MLNRRLLRVKVLQTLYGAAMQEEMSIQKTKSLLNQYINNFYKSYLLCWQFIIKVCDYNKNYKERLETKHIKSVEDINYSLNLAQNTIVNQIKHDKAFQLKVELEKQQYVIRSEDLKTLYNDLVEKKKYTEYINANDLAFEHHKKILIYIFNKLLLKSALFKSYFEDLYINWYDDKEFVYKNVNDSIRNLEKQEVTFQDIFQPIYKESQLFAESLLVKTLLKQSEYELAIEPFLKNWDLDRVTILDTILLKLAMCEFCEFSEIPVKVTINEYIELSKQYSTPKSKDFINGILDKLMKVLKENGKIKKTGRGLVDL